MWLGCALMVFAIGCGDEGTKTSPPTMPDPKTMMPDQAKMKELMDKSGAANPAASDTATEKPADGEKKGGETEKKEGDTEKKEGDAGEK